MGIREELRDFVIGLPGVKDPAERRAVVSSTRPTDMVVHLDFQGSDFAFADGLVTELSRRDKAALQEFLGTLYGAIDPSLEIKQKLDEFRTRVEVLDDAEFKAEFPAPLPTGVAAPPPKPDAAILAGALVGDVLAPHYALGAVPLRQKIGERATQATGQITQAVTDALADNPDASDILDEFKDDPTDKKSQSRLTRSLKRRLVSDDALAAELASLYGTATTAAQADGIQTLVDVSQEAGVVLGSMVGAVAGNAAVETLKGKISVYQQVDTVGPGGVVTGAVIGGTGKMNIGGQHHHGNVVNTGGGAYIGGNAKAGGDIVGRDKKVVKGDEVGGDNIKVGDISGGAGIAIGRGAQANVAQGVTGGELAQLFGNIYQKIDARPEDRDVDKDELVATVKMIEKEAAKDEKANANKVELWLNFLAKMAPDILEVTAATLANPIAGVATTIRKIAKKAQEGA